ncbi:MAG: protein kinase domain-containing protein [Kofleriaceae bacterium]
MAIPGVRPRFLAPGDKLGKFELIRQIAIGGMAELYLARTMGIEGFEKLVVVKRILPQYAENQQFVSMFLNEARLSATLHHPNITQVYDIGVEDGDYFFSMEYVHGEDLGRLHATATENGVPMSLDAALTLVAGLCAGLHYAHTKAGPDGKPLEVVHRDVSPSNVLVSYDGGVKLVDFGIARAGSAPATTRGGLKGKIAYMSPEQCKGEAKLDRRSDIFSIGTILYELTTGRLPFLEQNEYAVLNNIVNVEVPRPSTIVPSYAPALEAIVLKALSRDPAQRYASALELQKEIEDFAHENRIRVSPLVLARLMSTLFPARLEEWDQARAQGAFFVEQHVVRTLVESGKTQVEARLAQVPLPPIVASPMPSTTVLADDEPTDIVTALSPPNRPSVREPSANPFDPDTGTLPGQGPTALRALPGMPAIGRAPTPVPRPTPTPVLRAASPLPPAPTPPVPTPVAQHVAAATPQRAFDAPVAGTLVSNPSMDSAPVVVSSAIDVTERVRVRNDDTAFVRIDRKSRAPVFIGIGLLLAGAGIAAFIALSTDTTAPANAKTAELAQPAPERTPVIEPLEPRTEEPARSDEPAVKSDAAAKSDEPAAKSPEPAVKSDEPAVNAQTDDGPAPAIELAIDDATATKAAPKVEPTVEMKVEPTEGEKTAQPVAKIEAKRPKATKKVAPPKKTTIKKPVAEKPTPKKPEPKSEPKKEAEWNADSPFMPVRQ